MLLIAKKSNIDLFHGFFNPYQHFYKLKNMPISMEIKNKITALEKSKEFLDWQKKHLDSYFAHIFRMFDDVNKNIWQFGFYNNDDTITTFIMENDSISEVPEQKIFKKNTDALPSLDIKKIKIEFEDALNKAHELMKDKYKQHPIMKTFAILQKIDDKQVFNITMVTQTFNTVNIRIDSIIGDLISEKMISLADIARIEETNHDSDYIG
jgi:hypothetical protein